MCNLKNTSMGNYIIFKGFNRVKINKIVFKKQPLNNSVNSYDYSDLEDNGDDEARLKIST